MIENLEVYADLVVYADTAAWAAKDPIFLGAALVISIQLVVTLFGGGGRGKIR